ncbi:MAG: FAD-dependent thymidylate synthase [Candidatus Diapherotrites archaeon]
MAEAKLNVQLLAHTPNPDITTATAAHLCYATVGIDDLVKKVDKPYAEKLLKRLIREGHWSVLEHASFTFGIEGVSRALTHQLVRHRIASHSQQSQRYVNAKDFSYVIPPKIRADEKLKKKFEEFMEEASSLYDELAAAAPKEDARFILPNAAETKIIVTMNTRSLYNFFERRCCTRAQWEIRVLANKMLEEAKKAAPLLFEDAGAICERLGYCPEHETCGRYPLKHDALKEVKGK